MAAPNYHNFEYTQSVNPGHQQFETIGHPGKYTGVYKHTGGEFYFTGSNYGYGGMFFGSGSNVGFTPTSKFAGCFVELSAGGRIELADMYNQADVDGQLVKNIHEFSVYHVSSSDMAPNVYFLKRQQ